MLFIRVCTVPAIRDLPNKRVELCVKRSNAVEPCIPMEYTIDTQMQQNHLHRSSSNIRASACTHPSVHPFMHRSTHPASQHTEQLLVSNQAVQRLARSQLQRSPIMIPISIASTCTHACMHAIAQNHARAHVIAHTRTHGRAKTRAQSGLRGG